MKSGTALASSGWIKGGLQIARNKISTSINPLRQQRGLKVVSSSHLVLSHLNHFNSPSFGLCDPISWYHKNVLLKPLFVSLSFPSLLGPFAVFSLGSSGVLAASASPEATGSHRLCHHCCFFLFSAQFSSRITPHHFLGIFFLQATSIWRTLLHKTHLLL